MCSTKKLLNYHPFLFYLFFFEPCLYFTSQSMHVPRSKGREIETDPYKEKEGIKFQPKKKITDANLLVP